MKRRKINDEFINDQKSVYKKFKEYINKDPDNVEPVYKDEENVERRYFGNPNDVETFWKKLWQAEDQGNPSVAWLEDMENKLKEIIPNPYHGDMNVSTTDGFKAVKKKKNWSAAGPDKITNYWWKKYLLLHP